MDAEPPSQDTGNTFVGILAREGVEFVLNMLNNAITLHKRVVGTRHHCTPSQRCVIRLTVKITLTSVTTAN